MTFVADLRRPVGTTVFMLGETIGATNKFQAARPCSVMPA